MRNFLYFLFFECLFVTSFEIGSIKFTLIDLETLIDKLIDTEQRPLRCFLVIAWTECNIDSSTSHLFINLVFKVSEDNGLYFFKLRVGYFFEFKFNNSENLGIKSILFYKSENGLFSDRLVRVENLGL